MKYVVAELHPNNTQEIRDRFKGRVFANKQDVLNSIQPGETIVVRKRSLKPHPYVYVGYTFRKPKVTP